MEISDASDTMIYNSYGLVQDSSASFTYKVPGSASGGEYTIKVSNYQIPSAIKLVRIRDQPRDNLVVKVNIPFESYRPGDTVTGQIKVE